MIFKTGVLFSKKLIISTLSIAFLSTSLSSQSIENLLSAGKEDASQYLGDFMEPVFKGLVSNFNSGWYHSGKTHKLFGFDITINTTASFVPKEDKKFSFNNADYSVLKLQGTSQSANLPTVVGKESNTIIDVRIPLDAAGNIIPQELINSGTVPESYRITSFESVSGIEDDLPIAAIPSPMIQVGFGLPTKTDIKLRFIPNVGSDDVKFNMFGVGLQHNLLQHFLVTDKIPLIDLSILGAFTSSKTLYTPKDSSIATNQETEVKINAYTAQLVANANLKIINFYAGLGYTAGDASLKVKGEYTHNYDLVDINDIPLGSDSLTIKDPVNIEYDVKKGVKATLGMRLNLAWFKFFADYSVQEYNTLNVGMAFSFR